MIPSVAEIRDLAANRAYGAPIVTNYYRSDIVEAIVSYALANWKWCSGDWAGYDFKHIGVGEKEVRLEVKQSSALQSWKQTGHSKPKWDIAPRKGFWEGSVWTERAGRNADIDILAKHGETNKDVADHRDPAQWLFYVVAAADLPAQSSISESTILTRKLAAPIDYLSLGREVETLRLNIIAGADHGAPLD
jgi:hypothetical protein